VSHAARKAQRFHVPGHKGGQGSYGELAALLGGRAAFSLDFTELGSLDDPRWPTPGSPTAEAQALAAEAFGWDEARFLVGGATAGVLAMVLANAGRGDTLVATLPFHRSVVSACILAGCELAPVLPRVIGPFGVLAAAGSGEVNRAVRRHRAPAVLVTSPTYQGLVEDLPALVRSCRESDIPLLVDAAHGPHFGFGPGLPDGIASSGASASVVSLHKTAGALTPGALLLFGSHPGSHPGSHVGSHVGSRAGSHAGSRAAGGRAPAVDVARLDAALRLVETSSPPFPLLASMDLARRRLALHGARDWARTVELSVRSSARVDRETGGALSPLEPPAPLTKDPTRLVFGLRDSPGVPPDLTGFSLAGRLGEAGVDIEATGWASITAVATPADDEEAYDRLVSALVSAMVPPRAGPSADRAGPRGRGGEPPVRRELGLAMEKDCWEEAFVREMSLTEAFRSPRRRVPVEGAAGDIAADVVCPYPPGVPLVVPGQRISGKIVRYLEYLIRHGGRVQGVHHGRDGRTELEVVAW